MDTKEPGNATDDTLRGMLKDFYCRKNAASILIIWAYSLVFVALAVYCAIGFFETQDTQEQLLYAAVFITLMVFVQTIKLFSWQMIHRIGIKKELRRMESRIDELRDLLKRENGRS